MSDAIRVIEGVEGLEAVIGRDAVEAIAESTIDSSWHVGADRVVAYDGWDLWRESESPVSPADIDDWLRENVSWEGRFPGIDGWRQPGATTAAALESMLTFWATERVWSQGWFIDYVCRVEDELCRDFAARVEDALPSGYAFAPDPIELAEWLVTENEVGFDPNGGQWLDLEVCVDLFLGGEEEAAGEFSNIRWLGELTHDPGALAEGAVEEMLAANAVSWLAERRGLDRDAPIAAADPEDPGHDMYAELSENGCGYSQLTILTRCTIREWLGLVAATLDGTDLVVEGATAGLYDRGNGGGACLFGIEVPDGLVIPREMIHDVAIDPGDAYVAPRRRGLVASHAALVSLLPSGYGGDYTLHETCGCTDGLWPRGSVRPSISLCQAREEGMGLETATCAIAQ